MINVTCPYCGKKALLRPAKYVYGNKNEIKQNILYVCPGYPECDAYVRAHKNSFEPMGTMANKELRQLRIKAHRIFDKLWKSEIFTRDEAYEWMAEKFGLDYDDAHIGKLDLHMCQLLITETLKFFGLENLYKEQVAI